jgi:hypothetical protein
MFRHLFESFDHAEPDAMVLEEEIPVRRVSITLRNRKIRKLTQNVAFTQCYRLSQKSSSTLGGGRTELDLFLGI